LRVLWSEWPRIREKLVAGVAILLFDFDGTLAPIVADPSRAKLPRATGLVLARLARSPRVILGIISGRQIAELRRLVDLKNICYVGSHGLEWSLPSGRTMLRATPTARRTARLIAQELRVALRRIPGILVERKVASVAVHYRNASSDHARAVLAAVRGLAKQHAPRVTVLEGKKVVELLPAGVKSKGTAVNALLAHVRRRNRLTLVVYVGDDATDETVFRSLGRSAVTVLVGTPRRTRARFSLRSSAEVRRFAERVGKVTS